MSTSVKSVTFRDPVPHAFEGRRTTDRHFDADGHKLGLEVDLINRLVRLEREGQRPIVVPFENLAAWEPLEQLEVIKDMGGPEGIVDALLALGHRGEDKPKLAVVPPAPPEKEFTEFPPECGHPKASRTCVLCGAEPTDQLDQPAEGLEKQAEEQLATMKAGTEPGELEATVAKLADKIAEPGGKPNLVGCGHDIATAGCPVCDLDEDLALEKKEMAEAQADEFFTGDAGDATPVTPASAPTAEGLVVAAVKVAEEGQKAPPAPPAGVTINPGPERQLTRAERRAQRKGK